MVSGESVRLASASTGDRVCRPRRTVPRSIWSSWTWQHTPPRNTRTERQVKNRERPARPRAVGARTVRSTAEVGARHDGRQREKAHQHEEVLELDPRREQFNPVVWMTVTAVRAGGVPKQHELRADQALGRRLGNARQACDCFSPQRHVWPQRRNLIERFLHMGRDAVDRFPYIGRPQPPTVDYWDGAGKRARHGDAWVVSQPQPQGNTTTAACEGHCSVPVAACVSQLIAVRYSQSLAAATPPHTGLSVYLYVAGS